nr:PIG-L deacetylase family protein [Candidatus Sigynarchaeota archaeon]
MTDNKLTLDTPKSVLVFEAHSDDMVIGMGGLVKLLANQGVKVVVCTATRGETAHAAGEEKNIVETRKIEGTRADKFLGVKEHFFLSHGCQDLTNDRATFQEFVGIIRREKPDWIFTHGSNEWHRDHRAASQIVEEAWWKATEENVLVELGKPHKAKAVIFYEVLPQFDGKPDVCIDVSSCWDAKMEAIKCFQSQVATMGGFYNLVEGKGLYRGYLIGAKHAEAFMYSRFIPRDRF